jgi:hypothetical protein
VLALFARRKRARKAQGNCALRFALKALIPFRLAERRRQHLPYKVCCFQLASISSGCDPLFRESSS